MCLYAWCYSLNMAVPMFTRFGNIRNVTNINNISAIGVSLNNKHCSNIISRSSTTSAKDAKEIVDDIFEQDNVKKINKAMKIYLERSKVYNKFVEEEVAKYELGRRHLANMMGEDPENFDQKDIDRAIQYLLPSGIYDWRARPMMIHPNKLLTSRKDAEFDETGRPFHYLFYTCKPNYSEILHEIAGAIVDMNKKEDEFIKAKNNLPSTEEKCDTVGTEWFSKTELEAKIVEELTTTEYENFVKSFNRVIEHPMSIHQTELIMKYRKKLKVAVETLELPPLQYDSNDRPFVITEKCQRKSAIATVKVTGNGSGIISINGKDITYFEDIQSREQIIFPLIFTDMSDKVDIEATVIGGGHTGQAGAIRWGIAQGLQNFVDVKMIEKMRVAGLLTKDWRRRERKKWGQPKARKKHTWKKR